MATKNKYFTDLAVGEEFTLATNSGITYRKVSARKAIDNSLRDQSNYNSFAVRAHEMVQVQVPDPVPPTAEEKAAMRLRVLNYRLADMLERAAGAQDDLAKSLAKGQDGWFAVFTSSGSIEAQVKAAAFLQVATQALGILNHAEGGIDKLASEALRRAMRYARYGHHSTSAISNVAEEMQAAAWAEVAEACAWERHSF